MVWDGEYLYTPKRCFSMDRRAGQGLTVSERDTLLCSELALLPSQPQRMKQGWLATIHILRHPVQHVDPYDANVSRSRWGVESESSSAIAQVHIPPRRAPLSPISGTE